MRIKETLKSIIISIIIGGLLFGCGTPAMNTSTGGSGSNQININLPEKAIGVLPIYGYANGNDFADATALAHDMNKEYVEWKNAYISTDGIKSPASKVRVKRNDADKADTVSEGIGYGMLLAVYFNDPQTFGGLYNYSQSHRTDKTSPNARLMHWKINKNDEEVSEFDEYEVDTTTYTIPIGTTTNTFTLKSAATTIPQGRVMKNTRNGKIVVLPYTLTAAQLTDAIAYLTGLNKDSNGLGDFIAANVYPRDKGSSALDADEDMATALIMAYYRWHSQYYLDEAKIFTKDILKNCITATDFIKAGNLWGSESCWNPSYFAPAWYRLYGQICPEDKTRWDNVIKNGYAHFVKLNAANGTAGFFPDWCDTSGTTAVKANGSDRHYIDDDGKTDVTLQSYNYYYDGVRTPWRIAMDYSWFGSATETNAFNLLSETVNTVQNTIGIDKIMDGYAIDGGAWDRKNRDGFNNLWDATKGAYKNGGTSHSSTFVSMNATVSMLSNDAAFRKACFDETVNVRDALPLTYFGDCLRMMSLLYQSGRFFNFADSPSLKVEGIKTTKDPVTLGPLSIDAGNVNFAIYGIDNCKINDYAHFFTSDGSAWSSIGSGAKITTPGNGNTGEMNIGYCSVMGDIRCGTTTLTIRDGIIHGNVFARGIITNFSRDSHNPLIYNPDPNLTNIRYISGIIKMNIQSDEYINAMDFSASYSSFQTGNATIPENPNNQTFTLTPGNYGTFNTNGGNTISFQSGVYCFDSFTIGTADKLIFPTDGSVVIFVKNDMSMKSQTKMLNVVGGVECGADPSKILVIVGTSNWVKLEPQTHFRGTLIVPNGSLEGNSGYNSNLINATGWGAPASSYKNLSDLGESFGAFYAKNIEFHQATCTFLVPFNYNSIKGWSMPTAGSGGVVTPKSSDATLSSLTIGGTSVTLSSTPYSISVPNTTTSVTVSATTTSTKATYSVTANPSTLVVGANTVSVRVTAEDGTTKDYNVTVTRLTAGTTVPPTTPTTVTTSGSSYDNLVGENSFELTMPSGKTGTIQIKGKNGDIPGVQVSINGGSYQNLPYNWGGPITVPAGTKVTVKIKIPTGSTFSIIIEFWTGG